MTRSGKRSPIERNSAEQNDEGEDFSDESNQATRRQSTPRRTRGRNTKDVVAAESTPPPFSSEKAVRRLIYAQTRAGMFAADRIIFLYRPNIHTRQVWTVTEEGVIAEPANASVTSSRKERTLDLALVALKADLTPVTNKDDPLLVTSAIEVAEHIEGPVAGRIVRILYRIANDPPFLRHPRITVDMNDLMDDLGYERTTRGYHDAQNRARVRDVLLALSRVEIRGERFDHQGGRELYSAPLITIRGGYYQERETQDIALSDLLERGLPSKLHIELGWYEGVRRGDGDIGNNYLLLPRDLSYFRNLSQADHMKTEDLLAEFLWLRYSLQYRSGLTLSLSLDVALRHASITNRNITRARQTLEKALQSLRARGHVKEYSELPAKRSQSFTVTLQLPSQDAKRPIEPLTLWDTLPEEASLAEAPGDSAALEAAVLSSGDEDGASWQHDLSHSPRGYDVEHLSRDESRSTGSYFQVLRVGSYSLPAAVAWQRIRDGAQSRLSEAVHRHLTSIQPLWRVDTLLDGDIQYWLHLGITSGMRTRVESSETILQQIADQLYPKAFGIMFGAPHKPPPGE